MKFVNKNLIETEKIPNSIDRFVFNFVRILEKHVPYVIVSGYVAILLGRNRGTDDIDFFIPKIPKEKLSLLNDDLTSHGYSN